MEVRDLQPVFIFNQKVQKTGFGGIWIMANVKCVLGYFDTKLNRRVVIGETLEVSEERAKQLVKAKVAVMATTPETVGEEVKTPKRGRAKKEA